MKRFALAILTLALVTCDTPLPLTHLPPSTSSGPLASAASTDSAALAALYHATDGDNWENNENWLENDDLDTWYGITTDGSGRVTAIWLPDNDLDGSLPEALGDLGRLRRVDIANNAALTGPIPADMGNLGNLEHLNLVNNDLTGSIPSELGDLGQLERLWLGHNRLNGSVPTEIGDLGQLEHLWLSYNNLSGPIPSELGDLGQLENLWLSDNAFTGKIPPELGRLTSLWYLNLGDTRLNGEVPPSFGNLTNLRGLALQFSRSLSGELPLELTKLTRMESFSTYQTHLCAPRDPDFLAWLRKIETRNVELCESSGRDAYLIQSVQSRDLSDSVPLVAGEKALLRVFLKSKVETDEDLPKVRVRFYRNGRPSYVRNIPSESDRPIPTKIDEGDLAKSVNLVIPGRIIQPDLEMVLEIDPDSTLNLDSLGIPARIPPSGRMAVEVQSVPLLDLTAIPLLWKSDPDSAVIKTIDDMADDPEGHRLLAQTRTLLPVGDLYVTAHDPVVTDTNDAYLLLPRIRAIWAAEGGWGYYYAGMMSGRVIGAAGLAYVGHPAFFTVPSNSVIAHEFGHAMNLWHAPCGGTTGNDPNYPDSTASIVNWGYDFENDTLIPPSAKDLMSYCIPEWVSGYHFARATTFRVNKELRKEAKPPSVPSLLLWGGRNIDGTPFLEPGFVVDAPPLVPEVSGGHRLTGRDSDGRKLFDLSFDMPETADADGEYSSFAFTIPLESGWEGLEAITLSGPGGTAVLDSETRRPSALVRDPETGQVRALLLNLHPDTQTAEDAATLLSVAPRLTLRFSRGVPKIN